MKALRKGLFAPAVPRAVPRLALAEPAGARRVPVASNAESRARRGEGGRGGGDRSRDRSARYGLNLLARLDEDDPKNRTRSLVLDLTTPGPPAKTHLARHDHAQQARFLDELTRLSRRTPST